MCAIPQLVSAPLNSIPIAEHLRRSHPQCEHSYRQDILYCILMLYDVTSINLGQFNYFVSLLQNVSKQKKMEFLV